jgi:hypothetical protein
MTEADWTPEEDEAFNAVEKSSNLGKQILQDIEGQPYVYPPKREWVPLTNDDYAEIKQRFDIHDWPYAVAAKLKEKNDRPL